jgi:hypothetical protein
MTHGCRRRIGVIGDTIAPARAGTTPVATTRLLLRATRTL